MITTRFGPVSLLALTTAVLCLPGMASAKLTPQHAFLGDWDAETPVDIRRELYVHQVYDCTSIAFKRSEWVNGLFLVRCGLRQPATAKWTFYEVSTFRHTVQRYRWTASSDSPGAQSSAEAPSP